MNSVFATFLRGAITADNHDSPEKIKRPLIRRETEEAITRERSKERMGRNTMVDTRSNVNRGTVEVFPKQTRNERRSIDRALWVYRPFYKE